MPKSRLWTHRFWLMVASGAGVGSANFAAAARLAPRLRVELGANETVPPQRFYDWLLLSGADREPRRFMVESRLVSYNR